MALPLFVTRNNKYLLGAIMYAMGYVIYYLTNHFPISPPHYLHLTWIDQSSPFLPYSILIYISEYFYFAFVYILLNRHDNLSKYIYSFSLLQVVSCLVFILYPTIYPREMYPVPGDVPPWLFSTWNWLRNQDEALNCFPSLHVSSVFLSAFVFITDGKIKLFWFFSAWSTLIAISTLTTKQHYLADILSGLGLAILFFWWFHYQQSYRRVFWSTSDEGNAVE